MPCSYPLSAHVRQNPKSIDASLEKLTCTSKGITEVDIHPAALATLTAKASPSVQRLVKNYVLSCNDHSDAGVGPSPSSLQTSPIHGREERKVDSSPDCSGEGTHFNIALALSMHTVLLSRNRLVSLVGLVQFKNVVRLSLLGNRIRRIEDCEPLSLLPHLTFLSLEFNPVCALPHYRAHLLRITSWPKELSLRTCRLRKLDAHAVTPRDVAHAMTCLQREMSLLPELTQRQRLVCFLAHVEQTLSVHREMRRRGVLLHDTHPEVTTASILERCSDAALELVDFNAAAHATRLLVAEQATHQQRRGITKEPKQQGLTPRTAPRTEEKEDRGASGKSDRANDSSLNVSVETRANVSDGHTVISVLDDVSEICLEDLSWAKLSLSNAEQSEHDALCEEWSSDRFRAMLSLLDVRMCTHFLRTARMLGQTLTSTDVDDLCRIWMHILTRHEPVRPEHANVTGPRITRPVTVRVEENNGAPRAWTLASTKNVPPREFYAPAPHQAHGATPSSSPRETVVVDINVEDEEGTQNTATEDSLSELSSISANKSAHEPAGRTPPLERILASRRPKLQSPLTPSLQPTHPTRFKAQTLDGDDDGGSYPSSSAVSDVAPRSRAPSPMVKSQKPSSERVLVSKPPTAPVKRKTLCVKEQSAGIFEVRKHTVWDHTAEPSPTSALSQTALPEAEEVAEGQDGEPNLSAAHETPLDALASLWACERERAAKHRAFRHWCSALHHRHLDAQCAAYRAERLVTCADDLATLTNLNLISTISYIPRKGIFFQVWREKALVANLHRQLSARCALMQWRRRTREEQSAGLVHGRQCRRLVSEALLRWKDAACRSVVARCARARKRLASAAAAAAATTASPHEASCGEPTCFSPDPRRPGLSYSIPFDVSDLKRALSGSDGGLSSTSVSPIEPEHESASCLQRSSEPPDRQIHLVPPPPLESLQTTRQTFTKAAAPRRSANSVSSGAIVMSSDSPKPRSYVKAAQEERRLFSEANTSSTGQVPQRRRSPSSGLVRSPTLRRRSTSASGAPHVPYLPRSHGTSSPFSEDDVAALVEKASALQASRAVLVERVIGLQLECEQTRLQRAHSLTEAANLREKLERCEASLATAEKQRDRYEKEAKHLRHTVTTLREERREWLETVLRASKAKQTTVPPPEP